MPWEYYSFLNVEPTAEWDAIKRAAARKRRELEIANDSTGKAYLNEISQILRNPQTRADYDLLQRHGDAFSKLYNEARALKDKGFWPDAIHLYRQLLEMVPNHPLLLSSLAFCLAENGTFREAEKVYRDLVKRYPGNAVYLANFATVCLDLAERIPGAPRIITDRYDVVIHGVLSTKRISALNSLVAVGQISYEQAKALVKTAPQPLFTFVEKAPAEQMAQALKSAGVTVKLAPSEGKPIPCPFCKNINFLPAQETTRKSQCQFCHEEFSLYKSDREAMLRQGRELYQQAIALDPTHLPNYIDLVRSYINSQDYADAETWVERALAATGGDTTDNIGALGTLCEIYSLSGDQERLDAVVRRLQAVSPPGDADGEESITISFTYTVMGLLATRQPTAAYRMARAGVDAAPGNQALVTFLQLAENMQQVEKELPLLVQDLQIIEPVRNIVQVMIAEATAQLLDPRAMQRMETAFDTLYDFTRNIIRASVRRLKMKYPASYSFTAQFFSDVLEGEV